MAASLASAPINLSALREVARRELIELLDSVRGKKALVLDPKVAGPLGLIAEYSLLKDHGVESVYYLNAGKLETDHTNIVYFCRPKLLLMKYIADQVHANAKANQVKDYTMFMVPRRTKVCERILEDEGVYADIQLGEFNMDLVPFDDDLLSLEVDSAFRELALEGDRTSMYYVARSLMKLQSLFGIIPRITGKGTGARVVADMLVRMRREVGSDDNPIPPEIDQLILIDRSVDMITPMCSQLTYEGLIDEVFNIQNTYVDLEPAITGFKEKRKVPLNSSDVLYRSLRDRNFSTVGPLLNQSAKRINAEYEERHAAKTVSQIREFIGKLGAIQTEHQSLRIRTLARENLKLSYRAAMKAVVGGDTNVAERIMNITKDVEFHRRLEVEQNLLSGVDNPVNLDYIEELIHRQEPFLRVMRLLCLYSMTTGGLKPKVLENFRREIVQTYGYDKIFTLNNLEKVGLLRKAEARNNFPTIRKALRLFVDDVNEKEPNDVSYVYSGYAPLSVRLIQAAASKAGWKPMEEALKLLPGPTFDEVQALPPGLQAKKQFTSGAPQRVTIVFFLGGCTFTEIAALRFLSDQAENQRDYIVASTKLINGDTLLDTLVESIDNKVN